MTTVISRPLSRTLVAAALALVGTAASFGATTSPAQAAGAYSAKLAAPLSEVRREMLAGALWKCQGDTCTGTDNGSAPVNNCARVAKTFGKVTSFATPRGELTAEQLERCNARA
jgi:hypothetical protein